MGKAKAKKPLQFSTTSRVQKLSADTAMQALTESLQRTEDREVKLRGLVSELETELHKLKERQQRSNEELGAWMEKCRKETQKVNELEERLRTFQVEREHLLVRRTQFVNLFDQLRNSIRAGAVALHAVDIAAADNPCELAACVDPDQRLLVLLWRILGEGV